MGEFPEATYAALCATYAPRNPFREFAHAQITLNELRVLIRGLPDDSAMHREQPDRQGWRTGEYLLAEVVNGLLAIEALTAARFTGAERVTTPQWIETPQSARARAQQADEDRQALAEARVWAAQIEASIPA